MEPLNNPTPQGESSSFGVSPHFHRPGWTLSRRGFLGAAGLAGLSWLTPVGQLLAQAAEQQPKGGPAQSIILLWMDGGPSQLETFDPHPGTAIGGETRAIASAVKGIQLADGMEQIAEQVGSIALIRSMISKEGDHERGAYMVKNGYRPDPTAVHPSIGAICCHELPVGNTEIPRHISILPGPWPSRGGFLGAEYDAFHTYDPLQKVPDVSSHVPGKRDAARVKDLEVLEKTFAMGRGSRVESTLHQHMVKSARLMMTTEQLKAFDVTLETAATRKAYGDTPFGRGCLAARRLVEVGVRCVEVTLGGWDTHAENHALTSARKQILDPAFASLIRDLKERDLLRKTIVVWGGEFGRTPKINPLGGRDHWPKGFSVALAGGPIRGGQAIGDTDPEGKKEPVDPVTIGDLHATILTAVGLNPHKENISPVGRPIRLADGEPVKKLLG
jgi:hypothetical protein